MRIWDGEGEEKTERRQNAPTPRASPGLPAERWEEVSNFQAPDLSAGLSNKRIRRHRESWGTFISRGSVSPTPSFNYGELKGGWRGDEVGTRFGMQGTG